MGYSTVGNGETGDMNANLPQRDRVFAIFEHERQTPERGVDQKG